MGSQIALQTALSGRYDVTLVDSAEGQLERAEAQNRKLLERSVEKGRLTQEVASKALARITSEKDLAPAAGGVEGLRRGDRGRHARATLRGWDC